MSLHPTEPDPIPELTAAVARAALPRGNPYLRLRDELGSIYQDEQFRSLFSSRGQPAEAPWRLALVTVWQFVEDLSDRQAADAVRVRLDWKYALALELTDPGFDASVLSEFRSRLAASENASAVLDLLLEQCRGKGLLKAGGRQRTDSTHVLAAVRRLNRLELVRETMRHVLETLAGAAPEWLRRHSPAEWVERYRGGFPRWLPKGAAAQTALAETIGTDGMALLSAAFLTDAPEGLGRLPAVEALRQVWLQNYWCDEGALRWRTATDGGLPPSALFRSSPYDEDPRFAQKRDTAWTGYKVHLTETCEDDAPHLITHVETTPATTADGDVTSAIHAGLQEQGLLPSTHVVDTGYLDAELLVTSQRKYGVRLLGPAPHSGRWSSRIAEGFGRERFALDWEGRRAVCPEGHASIHWEERKDARGNDSIAVRFAAADCGPCPQQQRCVPSSVKYPRRSLALRPQEQFEALQERRAEERQEAYAEEYARRAGIEGTISEGVRSHDLRRSRYIGVVKTHLQHVLTATAMNLNRLAAWLAGKPRAQTRSSHFATLMA